MIKLIAAPAGDMASYYNGCTVFDKDKKPWRVVDCASSGVHCDDSTGEILLFNRGDLFVHYLPPFFSESGDIIGVEVSRSYKRAPTYDFESYEDLACIMDGTFKSTFNGTVGRIGRTFFCEPDRRIQCAVKYFSELCGFFKEGTFFITDDNLAERLSNLLSQEGSEYVVRKI